MRALGMHLLVAAMLCAAFFALGSGRAHASPPETVTTADPADLEGPVPVPEPTEQALQYYRSGNWLWVVSQAWGLLVPFALVWFGLSARIRGWAARVVRERWLLTIVAFWIAYATLSWLVDFPLDYYSSYVRPHDYGLSEQAFSKWFGDSLKGLALSLVFGSLLLWIPMLLLRRSPRRWWIYTSMVAVPLAFVIMIVAPIWIAPLFNEFGPLADKALEAKILAMADRAGIEGSRVFEVDKSVDTKTVNAYVAGLGSTKRIVLWDTIIAQLSERQLLFVMGHEMGHYVLGHIRNAMIIVAFAIPTTLCVVHYGAKGILRRFGQRFGFDTLADVAALPLIGLMVGSLSLVLSPGFLALSRHQEHESDRFGLEMTHDNRACAEAFAQLQRQNLGNPRPGWLFKLWRASHPPLGERIDFCNAYRPWASGEPERYRDRFRN